MQTPFEAWLQKQVLPLDSVDVFREAAISFKAGAYRAALLMSYLGFMSIVRDRVLAADLPLGIPQGKWDYIQRQLRDDSTWDQETFDATQCKQPAPIFLVTDDVRAQVNYWKNRRNDCAHSKPNAIGAAHVEAFWLFVESNLAKFVVNGSRQGLLAKLQRHYDPSYTRPGSDPSPLAAEVSSAVDHRELNDFFRTVTSTLTTTYGTTLSIIRDELFDFYHSVISQQDQVVVTALVAYLSSDEKLLIDFLRRHPERILLFAMHSEVVRRIWTAHLFVDAKNDFALFAALIRNGLIAPGDLQQANDRVLGKLAGSIPAEADVATLAGAGFFARLEDAAFEHGKVDKFDWGNPNASLIRWHLERFPISDAAVKGICGYFSGEPCAHGPRDALTALFQENLTKKAEFKAAAVRLQLTLPSLIPSLT